MSTSSGNNQFINNFKEIHNRTQLEALKNEIKGNLFEFLVAKEISVLNKIEANFLKNIDQELMRMMREYESWLRLHARTLLDELPKLAREMARAINVNIKGDITNITVVGKLSDHLIKSQLHEADIVAQVKIDDEVRIIPISLKLVKSGANITTKSAGAKSIFQKYFKSYSDIDFTQHTLNEYIDQEFSRFNRKLYERYDLEYSGRFDSQWEMTQLPGELEGEDREDLFELYRSLIKHYHDIFSGLLEKDKDKFISSLLPLMGLGNKDVVQGICFYKHNSYKLDFCHVVNYAQAAKISICELNPEISSFNIEIENDKLQIRVKPMNKFTAPSYKINCSMKFDYKKD
ncbi:hypothetical protein [Halobacteriovorax sp. RT-2-6]|uniref:hypothetical protein n=1 Tax=unclassified Halobacteriovorax TaxID=2639665 RepID=UPI00399ADF71